MNLGRLKRIDDLREVWKTEAQDFTPWLAKEENLTLLGETLNLELELEAVEKDVGPFRADILCRDIDDDSLVLVENQVERTDHRHLGQILTYAAGLNTVTIVWVAKSFTDEHRAALDWLNEITGEEVNFFGLEIELWSIGDSAVAPKFNVVSKPNGWTKGKGATKNTIGSGELTPIQQLKLDYWTAFNAYLINNDSNFKPRKVRPNHWMTFSLGKSRVWLAALVNTKSRIVSFELAMDGEENRLAIFNLLEKEKHAIEEELGLELIWDENPEKKMSRIIAHNHSLDPHDRKAWPEQHKWLHQRLQDFRKTFGERVRTIDIGDWEPELSEVEDE